MKTQPRVLELPDLGALQALEEAQGALKELARRTRMQQSSGICAEIAALRGQNQD